jgi:SOS regulatory protein LexA
MNERHRHDFHIQKIQAFYRHNRRLPTYREICEVCGFKSTNQSSRLITRLVKEGVLEKDSKGHIAPKHLFRAFRPQGAVQAGFPSPSEEDVLDTMSFDEYLLKDNPAPFILRVSGESMIDVGIYEGDLILVEMTDRFKKGDIVVARIEGGYAVKFYEKDKAGRVCLVSANKDFKPLYPSEQSDFEIKAVVRWVLRKV